MIIHEMIKKETTTRQLNSSGFVRKKRCEKYSKEYKNLSRNCQYYWYESYKSTTSINKTTNSDAKFATKQAVWTSNDRKIQSSF